MREKNKSAFTLTELLVVTVILSVISLTIYSTLSNGIRIWQRINKAVPEEDVLIFFDRFSHELRNTFIHEDIYFTGSKKRLEFPTLVDSKILKELSIGRVAYYYSSDDGVLRREQKDITQLYGDVEGTITERLKDLSSVNFFYYFYDKGTKRYLWTDEWSESGLPLAIRVRLMLDSANGARAFTRTVTIPVSR